MPFRVRCPKYLWTSLTPASFRAGLHNTEFPRTDAVVIVAIISTTGDKILLGLKASTAAY